MFGLNRKCHIVPKWMFTATAMLLTSLFALQPAGAQIVENPFYPGYPLKFSDTGNLDGVSGNRVVINDVSRTLAPGATFNRPEELNSGLSRFRAGDMVGFMLDSKGEVESIWLIPKDPKRK